MSMNEEVNELRKEIINIKKNYKVFLDIVNGIMKMVDYNNQELLRINNIENTSEKEKEKRRVRELRDYNDELIKVCENLEKLKNNKYQTRK